jgi:hypothetical protein
MSTNVHGRHSSPVVEEAQYPLNVSGQADVVGTHGGVH